MSTASIIYSGKAYAAIYSAAYEEIFSATKIFFLGCSELALN